jgi:hypothetical protein
MFTFTQWLNDFLVKAAGHKYIKRIPYQSGGKLRYRYIYNVTHTHQGKHMMDPSHIKEGTKLLWNTDKGEEVHIEIKAVDDNGGVVFQYDDGPQKGEFDNMSAPAFRARLNELHGIDRKVKEAREKERQRLQDARERGASERQIASIAQRVKTLGGVTHPAPLGLGNDAPDAYLLVAERVENTLDMIPETHPKKAKLRRDLEALMGKVISSNETYKEAVRGAQAGSRATQARRESAFKALQALQVRMDKKWKEALALVATRAESEQDKLSNDDREPPRAPEPADPAPEDERFLDASEKLTREIKEWGKWKKDGTFNGIKASHPQFKGFQNKEREAGKNIAALMTYMFARKESAEGGSAFRRYVNTAADAVGQVLKEGKGLSESELTRRVFDAVKRSAPAIN